MNEIITLTLSAPNAESFPSVNIYLRLVNNNDGVFSLLDEFSYGLLKANHHR